MERPLCPLCKTKHYAREGHVFKESQGGGVGREPVGSAHGPSTAKLREVARPGLSGQTPPPKFDRTAYQREYMREYRARKAFRA